MSRSMLICRVVSGAKNPAGRSSARAESESSRPARAVARRQ
jgi:hypothetical protein